MFLIFKLFLKIVFKIKYQNQTHYQLYQPLNFKQFMILKLTKVIILFILSKSKYS